MENIETLLAAVAQTQGFDDDEPVASAPPELKNSGSAVATRPSPVVETAVPAPSSALSALGPVIGDGEKRKRGRPPKSQVAAYPPPPKRKKVEDEEEDVCFICFDGGSLVLCDRKGCPKAYHPACIKRDEAFFQSKAKWNCGWHICSVCQKASYYMCYTCTYSLCKACTKNADYVRVRGNKGFCATCIKPIMLIENKDQSTNESIKVDFDDIHSWEYLFKMYWLLLKEKLSLTLSEITQAKNPFIAAAKEACKPHLSNTPPTAVGGEVSVSYRSNEHLESNMSHLDFNSIQNDGLKTSSNGNCISKLHNNEGQNGSSHKKDLDDSNTNKPCISAIESTEWASKDLLEFVAHMKNGDVSPISQFDVQTLLLAYIKTNDLRDPRKRGQIICDQRLKNLFGKPRVGHIEMLKLLEFHVLTKADSQKNSFIPAGFVSSTATDMENDVNKLGLAEPVNSRKRKTRKKSENNALQHDLNEYAAIDAHNINLIYLRRKLMENLIDDRENLDNKVIGSIVRIRISTNDQKPEVHRLVQVVGTTVTAEPYKFADKTTHIMLEVLNLDKKEIVSINSISNQEFTEEECRRLRQRVRCGLVKHFTIGEVQKKAAALQSVRVNDWLETEVSRLNHLRDRASEKGHKKELREYVDRLQLLNSPEERNRRISEAPTIHADPKMSPYYESEEDNTSGGNGEKDEYVIPSYSKLLRNRRNTNSNRKGNEDRSPEVKSRVKEKAYTTQINIDTSLNGNRNDQRSMLEASTATASVENSPSGDNIETEKLWHYRDPNGKIQGPFSIMQLRKWSKTGLFPPDMRIWTNHEQYDSLLLTDALIGKFHTPLKENKSKDGVAVMEASNDTSRDNKQTEVKVDESSSSLENSRSLNFDSPGSSKLAETIDILHLPNPTTKTENPLSVSSMEPTQSTGVFELPKSDTETKPPEFVNIPMPGLNGEEKLPEVADEWCGYSPTPTRQRPSIEEWDPGLVSASPSKPPEIKTEVVDSLSNKPNWSAIMNEPIEFLDLGEDSVSDLLAEVDAMESQGALCSPTAALKFARELLEDSKDDCFSSIEDFSSVSKPKQSEAVSSTSDVHFASQSPAAGKSIGDLTSQSIGDLTSQSSAPSKSIGDAFDFCRRSTVNSSASSEGETNNPVHMNHEIAATSTDPMDPGWGNLQGSNINLVTVQGNVNLVLGGSGSFDWGANPGSAWANPGPTRSPRNGSCLPWDGQRKYSGERFSSPREWGYQGGGESGFGRGRPPWGRQQYGGGGGGGYLRQLPKGQRVCKFYEGGRCKKGANCDYLHP